jgi:hypothetical protein
MIIVDVEIKKAIRGRNERQIDGIEYCDGWRDFKNMGIACVCTYDITTGLTRVFLEEDLGELAVYLHDRWTAGFNTVQFDNKLLAEHGIDIDAGQHYDILREIWIALGLDPDNFNYRTHGGWGLDVVCQATLGIRKTGTGALAPVWWQQGKRGKVIDYCCNDVWMEGQLLLHVLRGLPVFNGKGDGADHELILSRPLQRPLLDAGDTVIGRQYGAAQAKAFEEVATSAHPIAQEFNRRAQEDTSEVLKRDSGFTGGLGIKR